MWMGSRANVAAISALDTTNLPNNIVFAAASELKFLLLQKTSTETVDNSTVWAATPSGRWRLVGGSGTETIVSSTAPSTVLASGTTYVWQEDTTGVYPPDLNGSRPNSLITYVSNGTIWSVSSVNAIMYGGTPSSVGKPPRSIQEIWVDTSTSPVTRYGAIINASSNLDWEII